MYTLEDDQETSARLRKRDFTNTSYMAAGAPGSEDSPAGTFGEAMPTQPQITRQSASFPRLFSSQQITSSFKALTTPGQNITSQPGKRAALLAMFVACVGVFFTAMDQTVVVTVLPSIIKDPGINISFTHIDHAAWIVSAYLLGFVIVMPLMGRVSDIFGRRRILMLCLAIFGVGSILCALAPVFGQNVDLSFLGGLGIDTSSPGLIFLIAARFVQAVGGGAVVPVAMAVVSDFYGKERRGLALGIIGAVTEAGGVVGPLYGALIVQHLDWTYIFYLNAPIVLLLMIIAWFIIPKGKRLRDSIDWLGAILLGISLTGLSLGLAQQGTDLGPTTLNGAAPQNNPIALIVAVVFLAAFIFVEMKVRHPVIDLAVFKRFNFSASALTSLLIGAALIIAMADIPLFVDTVFASQFSDADLPLVSGLTLLRMTAMIPIGAFLGGWLCGRISCRFTGVLGLLFAATGFYLMSRWPMSIDWTQITISTVTTGLGFGLVVAPISTTAINSARATQAGMAAAIVTALRMLGMTLGLAALTSWALAYFKQLASAFRSLPATATSDQFAKWSQDYAAHLIRSAHTVYTTVFFVTMALCLIAILPAIFLWGNKPAISDDTEAEEEAGNALDPTPATASVSAPLVGTFLANADLLDTVEPGVAPPVPPNITSGNGGNGGRKPRRRRRLILALLALFLLLLIGGGIFVAMTWNAPDTATTPGAGTTPVAGTTVTPTPIAGPRMMELALDKGAVTSIFVSQLGLQSGTLTDMQVIPAPGDAIIITLNLHIDSSGIHRVMPVELDGTIGVDNQQNIQLRVQHLKRDGLDAGPAAAKHMEQALNQLLISSVMPSLRGTLKTAKLISIHTSSTVVCGVGIEMLTLLIQAPPIQGIAAQPTPVAFCFKGPVDLNKLLPN